MAKTPQIHNKFVILFFILTLSITCKEINILNLPKLVDMYC